MKYICEICKKEIKIYKGERLDIIDDKYYHHTCFEKKKYMPTTICDSCGGIAFISDEETPTCISCPGNTCQECGECDCECSCCNLHHDPDCEKCNLEEEL